MTNDELLNHFVKTWPLSRVKKMTLEEYNKQGSKDSFCYMLEYGTRELGNISGTAYASKFEIYERKQKDNIPKSNDYGYDEDYTWRNRGGVKKTRQEAFEYTKNIIEEIIEASQSKNYKAIDGKGLAPLVVWKIAFLYSNKNLLAISDRKALRFLGKIFGVENYEKIRISSLHSYFMKLVDKKRYWEDMWFLWSLYKNEDPIGISTDKLGAIINKKGVTIKDIENSVYQSNIRTIVVTKKHNQLQTDIYTDLCSKYGDSVLKSMEENNIDIKVEHETHIDFYEVKIAESAKYCIRKAIGQILEYAFNYNTPKKKRLIIVGNHPLKSNDESFLNYLKKTLQGVDLEYIHKNI